MELVRLIPERQNFEPSDPFCPPKTLPKGYPWRYQSTNANPNFNVKAVDEVSFLLGREDVVAGISEAVAVLLDALGSE